MIKTILFLIGTLVLLPFFAFSGGIGLDDFQFESLMGAIKILSVVAFACFFFGEVTRNYSQVDKIWSIVPAVYVWYFAYKASFNPRMVLMAIMVTIWAARLTFNFARRGGYSLLPWKGEEDYRWPILRENAALKGRFRWGLFNLFFISAYQNGLIFLFTLPILFAWKGAEKPLGTTDFAVAFLMLALIIIEFIADQQQYDFQSEKHRKIKAGETLTGIYKDGFTKTGLWALVRHPNYSAEQAIWISFYLFSVSATGEWFNWSITGAILLVLLFLIN